MPRTQEQIEAAAAKFERAMGDIEQGRLIPGAPHAPSPEELALRRARDLRESSEQVVEHAVLTARAAAVPWTRIGLALGVSRQAAQARYGHLETHPHSETVR